MIENLISRPADVKVLDFLLDEWEIDFSTADIARETGMEWRTVSEVLPKMVEWGLVKHSRDIARARMYRVNLESRLFKALKKFAMVIAIMGADKIAAEELSGAERMKMKVVAGTKRRA